MEEQIKRVVKSQKIQYISFGSFRYCWYCLEKLVCCLLE